MQPILNHLFEHDKFVRIKKQPSRRRLFIKILLDYMAGNGGGVLGPSCGGSKSATGLSAI